MDELEDYRHGAWRDDYATSQLLRRHHRDTAKADFERRAGALARGIRQVRICLLFYIYLSYEQALVCLSNTKKSTRADVDHLLATWRITVGNSYWVGLISLAI